MTLESLSSDLFVPMAMDESASVLGGTFGEASIATFQNCYTFLNDGSYRTDDKDQDASTDQSETLAS